MIGSINALFAATVFFVAGHFLLSSTVLRRPLAGYLGEGGFRALYSLFAAVTLVWMVIAYGDAPFIEVWSPPAWFRWVPILVMPFASLLVVGGLSTRNLTAVGGERLATTGSGSEKTAPGIISVTRHPALWGFTLWALSHLAVNGDLASIILMTGITVLSLGGMAHIDQRREDALGAGWGPTKLTTSAIPFAAIASGRTKLDWRGIGWGRLAGGLALYVALLYAHPWIAGVSVLPG